jgi:hypothetical protein
MALKNTVDPRMSNLIVWPTLLPIATIEIPTACGFQLFSSGNLGLTQTACYQRDGGMNRQSEMKGV